MNDDRPALARPAQRVERANADRPTRTERVQRAERPARPGRVQPVEQQVQPVQQAPAPVQQVQTNETQRGGLAGGFTRLGQEMAARGQYADNDDRDHDHDWSKDWRKDHRYDWWSYRNHHRSLFRFGSYYDPYSWGYRRWSIGWSMWPSYYGSNYWLDDPWMYRLPPAYGPYRWVRYYDDALLVNIYTGQVVDVVYNFFW